MKRESSKYQSMLITWDKEKVLQYRKKTQNKLKVLKLIKNDFKYLILLS